jgi:hypothetical protein
MGMALAALGTLVGMPIVRVEAEPKAKASSRVGARMAVDADEIAGVVTSSKEPEAGVRVIAETSDLETKFRKIVVTNDRGQWARHSEQPSCCSPPLKRRATARRTNL